MTKIRKSYVLEHRKPQVPAGTQPKVKIYNVEVSIKPVYFTVGEACKSRREAERFAAYVAEHPFEFVPPKKYVSWKIEKLTEYPEEKSKRKS